VGSLTLSGFVALMARTAVAVTPMGLADWRWVAEDEYAHLAEKTTALVGRAYLRMVPLHVGLVAVLGPQIGSTARRAGGSLILSLSIVVVAATFVGSWWPTRRWARPPMPARRCRAGHDRARRRREIRSRHLLRRHLP
jgi:hypothetical protein